jgi:hypothetical protein
MTPTAPLTLEAAPEHSSSAFPERILSLLRFVAERNPTEGSAPYEDEHGEPMQDDAEAAIRWISEAQSALTAQAATIAQLEARLREAEADVRRYQYIQRWTRGERNHNGRKQQFNFDFPPPLGNVMQGSVAQHLDAAIDAAIAAHGKDEA